MPSVTANTGAGPHSHLDRVLHTKILTVCTTGDYQPYTFLRSDGEYEGVDISMVHALAASLGATIKWVPTSWKTLMSDFICHRCDLALGGISVTLERQQTAWFTTSLGADGKIPLVRREDKQKYQTLDQINQAGIRVIEPAGGTNEAFARRWLPHADLLLVDDNVALFQQLADNKADVMITEASEALYQQQHYPQLYAVNPEQPLEYGEKAFMLPRDDMSWKLYVDQWLHLSQATRQYSQMIARQLAGISRR